MKKLIGIFAAFAMVLSCAMTAAAAEWNFYGNARVGTFVHDTDNPGAADTQTLSENLQSNSRIGAKVKVSDELRGRFEYGTGVNVRHLFGEWDFGAGKLLVGQTYTPMEYGVSNQVFNDDNGLGDYGSTSVGRNPMIRLTFGGFKIAAVAPEEDDLGTGGTIEHDLPKIEAAYAFDFDNIAFEIGAGYNEYEIISGAQTYDVDSWVISLGAEASFGAFYCLGSVYTGENLGSYGFDTASDSSPSISGTTLNDNDGFGYNLECGGRFNLFESAPFFLYRPFWHMVMKLIR